MTKPWGSGHNLDSQQTETTAQKIYIYKHNHAPYSSSMFFSFIDIFDYNYITQPIAWIAADKWIQLFKTTKTSFFCGTHHQFKAYMIQT